MKRLLVVVPNKNDTTSWHRGYYPMMQLHKDHLQGKVEYVWEKEITIADACYLDGAFIQRPFDPGSHLNLIKLLKHCNVPVWVDWDDDLLTVPEFNPSFKIYGQDSVKGSVKTIQQMADIATVSTLELQRVVSRINKNTIYVPNSINEFLEPARLPQPKTNKIVMWRGSDTHFQDIHDFTKPILQLAEEHPDWAFVFWAYNPTWITTKRKNCVFEGGVDILSFYKKYQQIAPKVTIVPLHDCVFNKSKSCTAWQQAVFSGGVAVAPDWEEWRRPGALLYKDEDSFYKQTKSVITDSVKVDELSKDGWNHIQENMTLTKTNLQRKQILEKLLKINL
jgi:hypothetical protein